MGATVAAKLAAPRHTSISLARFDRKEGSVVTDWKALHGEMIAIWLITGMACSSVGRLGQSTMTECSGNVVCTSSPVWKVLPRTSITRSSVPSISI